MSNLIWSQAAVILVIYFGIRLMGLPRTELTKAGQTLRWAPVLALTVTAEAILLFCAWLLPAFVLIPAVILALLAGNVCMEVARIRIYRNQRLRGLLAPKWFEAIVPRDTILVQVQTRDMRPYRYLRVYYPGDTYSTREERLAMNRLLARGESVLVRASRRMDADLHDWKVENCRGRPRIRKV